MRRDQIQEAQLCRALASSAIGLPISRPSIPVAFVLPRSDDATSPRASTDSPQAAESRVKSPGVLDRYTVLKALTVPAKHSESEDGCVPGTLTRAR